MYTLVEELSNCSDYFLRLSGFPDLFGKAFLIPFKFSLLDSSTTFLQEQCKLNSSISFFIIEILKPLFITITYVKIYFSLISILKSKKKKLALTSFYCLGQETWLDNSRKLICINQSRFYNFFHVRKFKNFSTFNNKPPARWVTHITKDFIICYSCSYYSFMIHWTHKDATMVGAERVIYQNLCLQIL